MQTDSTEAEIARQHAENAKEFGEYLKGITEEYQIAYIELDKDLAVDKVCDIFTQINSQGIRLDVFDLINALLKPKGLQLKHMWRKARPRLGICRDREDECLYSAGHVHSAAGLLLSQYLYYLLPGRKSRFVIQMVTAGKKYSFPISTILKNIGIELLTAVEKAIMLLRHPQEFGVISSQYLPYVSILPVFAALQHHISTIPASNKSWMLNVNYAIGIGPRSSLNRYSGSVESTSARDFLDVKAWLEDEIAEPPLIQEFKQRFKTLELRKETKRGTSVYNGIFNLLVLQGARDWMTGNIPQHGDLDDHHIVPASWGNKKLKNNVINSILNRTPLSHGYQ